PAAPGLGPHRVVLPRHPAVSARAHAVVRVGGVEARVRRVAHDAASRRWHRSLLRPVVRLQRYHVSVTGDREGPTYLSRAEAARRLGVSVATVDRMIRHGLLERYRYAGLYVRVSARQVDELST